MFYTSLLNNISVIQQPFIFIIGKISYDTIYYNKNSTSKIVTAIVCYLGAKHFIEKLTDWWPEIKSLISIPVILPPQTDPISDKPDDITPEEDEKLNIYNERSDVSEITNDVDRLLEQSNILCENN